MDATIGTALDAQIDALQDQIERAQTRGDSHIANDLYQKQLALAQKLPGGRDPAVGEGGRAA
jgi:hypothetical protein